MRGASRSGGAVRAVKYAAGCVCRYQIYVGTDLAICMEGVEIPESVSAN